MLEDLELYDDWTADELKRLNLGAFYAASPLGQVKEAAAAAVRSPIPQEPLDETTPNL